MVRSGHGSPYFARSGGTSCLIGVIDFTTLQIKLKLLRGDVQISLVYYVVPVEDGAGLVTGDQHGDPLRHSSADQISHSGTPQVVKKSDRIFLLID